VKRHLQKFGDWLERRWVQPAFAGWFCLGLSLFYLGSAANTMSGWLYAISGASLALLGIAAILPPRSLRHLQLKRQSIDPVSSGESLTVILEIHNPQRRPKLLLQLQDEIPPRLGTPPQHVIESLAGGETLRWIYQHQAAQRGIYHWDQVSLRTAAPLGLFWCRRSRQVPGKAIVYPQVLPLQRCPLIDGIGQEDNPVFSTYERQVQPASEGLTRALRPYRFGDPMRMIHWRTSARYGELRVRELEVFQSGLDAVIALDTAAHWDAEAFEQGAIAAASLYFYASQMQLNVRLWTAKTGVVHGHRVVLETLAGASFGESFSESETGTPIGDRPTVWLTPNAATLDNLTPSSRWILWGQSVSPSLTSRGICIDPGQDLQRQLQSLLN
jgi:uncharacterized protein (DUF58 family)